MKRDNRLYLWDMLDHARQVNRRTGSISREAFDAEEDVQLAIIHLLQIIGEAAWRADASTRAAHPEIDGVSIANMRHKLVHDYFRVDLDVIWKTACEDIPPLIGHLERMLEDRPGG